MPLAEGRLAEVRRELRERKPEVLNPGTKWELVVTPAERLRYEANRRFGEAVAADLYWLVDHQDELTREEILKRYQREREKLRPAQQEILDRVAKKILREFDRASDQSVDQAHQKFVGMKKKTQYQFDLIHPEEIHITKLGAIVTLVKEEGRWHEIVNDTDSAGFVLVGLDTDQEFAQLSQEERNFLMRAVFVSKNKWYRGFLRHELFHDLYKLSLSTESRTAYAHEPEETLFLDIKDEMIAHGMDGDWQSYIFYLEPKISDPPHLLSWEDLTAETEIYRALEKKFEKVDPAGSRWKNFSQELFAMQRELARLHLARKRGTGKIIGSLITAQSFKEIAYQLSMTRTRPCDAIDQCVISTRPLNIDIEHAGEMIYFSRTYDFPVARLDSFVEYLERYHGLLQRNKVDIDPQFRRQELKQIPLIFQLLGRSLERRMSA